MISSPYFEPVPIAELIEPAVIEATEAALPSLVPPYVDAAAQAAVQQLAVLLTGSTMSGPLFLSPLMPTQPSQAATMAYVDSMIATAGIPEVPPVPSGQVWARETGQWVPITPQTGVFLPLSGGAMTGNINMSGNTIQNMAAVPAMPNGAAPAQWVLNQIAAVSLYQGTWDADTNTPDLTQLSTHVNAYTWIALTTAVGGVVIGAAIPGLQGQTIYNGDTIIYSTVQGAFTSIHAGGLTAPEADARYVQLAGSQMSGPLLLNANASQPLQAVTYQQLEAFVPPGAVGEAPNDGQLYGRNGLTQSWSPVLPLAGGILTGALTLSGNATANLNPVPLQQMTTAITAATAGYLPLAGAAMTGLMTLSGNASVGLNPVPLQQLNGMLASYATLTQLANYLPLTGGTLTGALTVNSSTHVSGTYYGASSGGANIATTNGHVANFYEQTLPATQTLAVAFDGGAIVNLVANSNCSLLAFGSGAGPVGVVLNGNDNATGFYGIYVDAVSDQRIKANIAASSIDALSLLSQIPVRQYDVPANVAGWFAAIGQTGAERDETLVNTPAAHVTIGLVTQEVSPLIPEAVTSADPAKYSSPVDSPIPADVQSLNSQAFIPYLVMAVQQLGARVAALDGRPL